MNKQTSELTNRLPRVRGVALIEMAVALVIVGAAIGLLLPVWLSQESAQAAARTAKTMDDARQGLRSYASLHDRLPCPSVDTGGIEQAHCDPGAAGYLPYLTLGLPDAAYAQVTYRLPEPAGGVVLSADPPSSAFVVLRAQSQSPVREQRYDIAQQTLRSVVGTDTPSQALGFCTSLERSGIGNVAAELGLRSASGGGEGGVVTPLMVGDLWASTRCAGQVAVDGRDRFNLGLVAAGQHRLLQDAVKFAEFGEKLNEIDVAATAVQIPLSTFHTAMAAWRLNDALIAAYVTMTGNGYAVGLATAEVGFSLGKLATTIAELGRYGKGAIFYNELRPRMENLTNEMAGLQGRIDGHAQDSASRGLLLWRP